jgi:hypothetical protein
MTELHVIPEERTTTWRVYQSDASAPLSQHADATEAELAARAWAEQRGAERIFVHDRYHRTHEAFPSLAAVMRARAEAARRRGSSH